MVEEVASVGEAGVTGAGVGGADKPPSEAVGKRYADVPYAVFFKREMGPILDAFDAALPELEREAAASGEPAHAQMVTYMRQYRHCLGLEDREQLEIANTELDVKWMAVKGYWIHIVHDIEYG